MSKAAPPQRLGACGDTTTTDSRSQRNRGGRRGGQLLTRALGSWYGTATRTWCPRRLYPGWSHHTPEPLGSQLDRRRRQSSGYEPHRKLIRSRFSEWNRRTELLLPNAGIMVRDRRSHRIRGWQEEPCLENRSSPEIGNRSLTSTPSYEEGTLRTSRPASVPLRDRALSLASSMSNTAHG